MTRGGNVEFTHLGWCCRCTCELETFHHDVPNARKIAHLRSRCPAQPEYNVAELFEHESTVLTSNTVVNGTEKRRRHENAFGNDP